MNYLKTSILSLTVLFGVGLTAQKLPSEATKEVTEKTFKMNDGEKTIENSVKITTVVNRAVMVNNEKNTVNRERIFPPKVVTKTVEIDNDADSKYDEKIKFSYLTDERTDFTLVSNRNDVQLAIEEGEALTILENQKLFKTNQDNRTTYVYTDEDGKKIEFRVENNDWNKKSK